MVMSDLEHRPPTPDRQGVDPGTWLWILLALAVVASLLLWAAYN